MTHKIDRHFGKTAKVSSQIIPYIYNKLYALHLGGGGGGSFHNFICKNCYHGNKGVEDMIHDIDRHFGKTVKVSSQIIRNIHNKLYALYSGGGRFKILFIY